MIALFANIFANNLFIGQSKRGVSTSFFFFPLSFVGEGDTGGEVEKKKIASLRSQ